MLQFIDLWCIYAAQWGLYTDYNKSAVGHICAVWQAYASNV